MPRKSRTERDPEKKAFMEQLLAYYQPKTVADMQEMSTTARIEPPNDGIN